MLKLSDICSFVSDKINIEELSTKCYVSTDNMLPDCGGMVEADTIPNVTKTSAFSKGDVLFSNIRPYFRKVWLSDRYGGCSNDVLVLRPLPDISSLFLYYVVSDAGFIKYVMKGAKGTKMPRGDKSHIMNYEINPIALKNSEKIVSILGPIDYKIQINKHINDNLEDQVSLLYDNLISNYHTSLCKTTLGEISEIVSGKRPLSKTGKQDSDNQIPIVGAAAIMGYTSKYLYDEPILVTGRVGTHGVIQRYSEKSWPSDNTLVIKSNFYEYVYQVLKRIDYKSLNRGSTQPLITQNDLKSIEVLLPPQKALNEFEYIASYLMQLNNNKKNENMKLCNLRDFLLPKLMSGQIQIVV